MLAVRPWQGATVLDIGCGTGFFLPPMVTAVGPAGTVIGVEPHHASRVAAAQRCPAATVLPGTAGSLPVRAGSVDIAHARFAYFFGPGCEPGLAELERVVRRGGHGVIIDVDATRSDYGRWFARNSPDHDPDAVMAFFSRRGWQRHSIDMDLRFDELPAAADVLSIEFAPAVAAAAVAELTELAACRPAAVRIGYAVNLWTRAF